MRIAPVTGDTGDGRDQCSVVIFIGLEKFLVDLTGHLVHLTRYGLFRLGITGEIEMMRIAVRGRRMTKTTLHT